MPGADMVSLLLLGRGGRVVEGDRLLSGYRAYTSVAGSNPALSASFRPPDQVRLPFDPDPCTLKYVSCARSSVE